MMVEDGRRLILSNLQLRPLTTSTGPELKNVPELNYLYTADRQFNIAICSRKDKMGAFPLLSAVRLNASFPYVMHHSQTFQLSRCGDDGSFDAGYYDNYGVRLAADWLTYTLDEPIRFAWLMEGASPAVMVVQIRDGILDLAEPIAKVKENPW